jgi:hypothetical protein
LGVMDRVALVFSAKILVVSEETEKYQVQFLTLFYLHNLDILDKGEYVCLTEYL